MITLSRIHRRNRDMADGVYKTLPLQVALTIKHSVGTTIRMLADKLALFPDYYRLLEMQSADRIWTSFNITPVEIIYLFEAMRYDQQWNFAAIQVLQIECLKAMTLAKDLSLN